MMKNWCWYAYTVRKLQVTFQPRCTHASFCHALRPFAIHLILLCVRVHPLQFEPDTSQSLYLQGKKKKIKPIPDTEELSPDGSFMPCFPTHQCEGICSSSACTHSHQLAPADGENLSSLGTEREIALSLTSLYHCLTTLYHCVKKHVSICPPYPSALFCLTVGLEGPLWVHRLWWLFLL